MSALEPIPVPDSTAVQLTRMEGKLDLINFQVADVRTDVAHHEGRIGVVELEVQRLKDAAVADKETVEQTAKALKAQADQSWSPMSKMLLVMTVLSTLIGLYFAIAAR